MPKIGREKFYLGIRHERRGKDDTFYVGRITSEEWQEDARIYFPPVNEIDWARLIQQGVVQPLLKRRWYKFSPTVSATGLRALEEEMAKLPWVEILYVSSP